MLVNHVIPLESFFQNIQILRERNIVYLAESDINVLKVYPCSKSSGTELIFISNLNELSADNMRLVPSPIERLYVVVEFFDILPNKLVLIYLFPCYFILQCHVISVLLVHVGSVRYVVPLLFLVRRAYDLFSLLISHRYLKDYYR